MFNIVLCASYYTTARGTNTLIITWILYIGVVTSDWCTGQLNRMCPNLEHVQAYESRASSTVPYRAEHHTLLLSRKCSYTCSKQKTLGAKSPRACHFLALWILLWISVTTPWIGDRPVARSLIPTKKNTHTHKFAATIPVCEEYTGVHVQGQGHATGVRPLPDYVSMPFDTALIST
jgi:hypothetical protein